MIGFRIQVSFHGLTLCNEGKKSTIEKVEILIWLTNRTVFSSSYAYLSSICDWLGWSERRDHIATTMFRAAHGIVRQTTLAAKAWSGNSRCTSGKRSDRRFSHVHIYTSISGDEEPVFSFLSSHDWLNTNSRNAVWLSELVLWEKEWKVVLLRVSIPIYKRKVCSSFKIYREHQTVEKELRYIGVLRQLNCNKNVIMLVCGNQESLCSLSKYISIVWPVKKE